MYNGVVDSVLLEAAVKAKINNVEQFMPKDGFIMWVDHGDVEGMYFWATCGAKLKITLSSPIYGATTSL
jgi:hypothetical protein